ncbi:MAG TPA: hypothetical protein VGK17_05225 [Propionicimonas sp.]
MAVGKDYLVSAGLGEIYPEDPYRFLSLYSQNLKTGEVRKLNFWGDMRETEIDDKGVGTDVVVAARFDRSSSAIDVIPLDGSIMYPRLEVFGLLSATLQGEQAVYVISGAEHPLVGEPGPQRCVRSFAGRVWGPAHCEPVS